MFEKVTVDVSGLALMTDEVAGLARKGARHGGARKVSVCLVTLNNVLNNLNVLNIFGGLGGFGL
jgi:hypothetical protein